MLFKIIKGSQHEIVRKILKSLSEFRRVIGSRGNNVRVSCGRLFWTRFRWPSAHCKDRHGGDCCSYTRHWKCPQIVPVVEGELPLLLIYYRLSPMLGWRVIEQPGHPSLQVSFQTTNTKETLTATFYCTSASRRMQ